MTTTLPALTVHDIRAIVRPLAPTATVYLGIGSTSGDREEDWTLRSRAILGRLGDLSAPVSTVETVRACLDPIGAPPAETAVGVAGTAVLINQPIPGWSRPDRCGYGTPAHVLPLLSWLQRHPPYVEVLIDRTGAEVISVHGGELSATSRHVDGPDDEIERNAPGGWAQPRYHRRAEDSWRHNATAVAEVAAAALREVNADLLLLGGDVRAAQLFGDRIRERVAGLVVRHVPGGRHPDGSAPARAAAVRTQVAAHADQTSAAVSAALQAELGPHGRGVVGVTNTLAALTAGRIRTLIVVDDEADQRCAWFGPDALCVDESTVPGLPPDRRLRPGRLIDVAVRAALLTDADVHVLHRADGLPEGIGGLCRFPA
jgi:hypothetical protein